MIKSIVKILLVVLVAHALWRLGSSYVSYYRFRDAVTDLAIHATRESDGQIKDKVMALAAEYGEPVDPDALEVRQEEHHTYVETTYTKPVLLLPGYEYQWLFSLKVDGFVVVPVKLGDLANPQ